MNVVFLDFDGVVNIPIWREDKLRGVICDYNDPDDKCVNHFQAVQWVSEFCEKYNYSIVVSSTWRMYSQTCAEILYNGGLREDIRVVGTTPIFHDGNRGDEITAWLSKHPEVENYLIFDDDSDMGIHLDKLVKCNCHIGFMLPQYDEAKIKHGNFCGKKRL